MLARLGDRPVGFFLGHEGEPQTFVGWSWGVHPAHRRQGVATQMFEAVHEWAYNHHYEVVRLEFSNSARGMLHMALDLGYEVTGVRCDPYAADRISSLSKSTCCGKT